jgi:hypothetical protein
VKESSRKWLDASITLAKSPSAQVLCPQCEAARLTVTDAFAGDVMERWMQCPSCGACNTLLKREAQGNQAATPLERAVIEDVLAAAHPVLEVLRDQWAASYVSRREFTGVGSYTTLLVPPSARALATTRGFALHGPSVHVLHREEPIGSVLLVEGGRLGVLEMFTYSEPWPEDVSTFSIVQDPKPRDLSALAGVGPSGDL